MKQKQVGADRLAAGGDAREGTPREPGPRAKALRVRTGLRAGDVYMQYPKGSNNGTLSSP
jgi:hypothetical protein